MSPHMRFSTAGDPASLAEVCKLAWHTFYGMQKASEDFENLRFEVWTIAISLDSLHSVGTTPVLIDRQPDRARWALTFSKILASLASALRPLHSLVRLYLSSPAKDRASIKNWLLHSDSTFEGLTIQDFRRKLSMLVESLNVFLSCLTHAELARAKNASESEEFRVLSEVTRNVMHKWDHEMASGIRRPTERPPQLIEAPGYVNDDVKSYMMPLLNGGVAGFGLGMQSPKVQPPTIRQQHSNEVSSPSPSQKATVPNLEGIEHGFRNHMHAMRRIREQLRQQKINNNHLSTQRSTHFPEVLRSANDKSPGLPAQLPPTPNTPTLHRELTDSTQSSSDFSGDYADASSNNGSSEADSVISNYHPEETKPIFTVQPPSTLTSGPPRKRKRQAQFRFKTGLEDEQTHSHLSDGSGSGSGSGSDDGRVSHSQPKTALQQLLTTVLFFDQ
ncbi:hypothetical protein A1O3_04035 [Capronia epimyces CBS 606.96]|uniref:Fungal N-terminal domain-containing protein n=1 Tax=Capronia epimyces CBS 606.96 TaxID=1182542 RepID=W9Y2P2_9EURO|nr:uncharacterized protein A1O3_04035 [Capronia epimyces CBS 606.96]EXJ87077.1 hypothetical protein A1O3_04035 [Capronia epimyces CBS 606.96]